MYVQKHEVFLESIMYVYKTSYRTLYEKCRIWLFWNCHWITMFASVHEKMYQRVHSTSVMNVDFVIIKMLCRWNHHLIFTCYLYAEIRFTSEQEFLLVFYSTQSSLLIFDRKQKVSLKFKKKRMRKFDWKSSWSMPCYTKKAAVHMVCYPTHGQLSKISLRKPKINCSPNPRATSTIDRGSRRGNSQEREEKRNSVCLRAGTTQRGYMPEAYWRPQPIGMLRAFALQKKKA